MLNVEYSEAQSKMNRNPMEGFETRDLWIASFLKTRGANLNNVRRKDGKVYFLFSDSNKCQSLVDDYFQGAKVSANHLKNNVNFFRDIIFSG